MMNCCYFFVVVSCCLFSPCCVLLLAYLSSVFFSDRCKLSLSFLLAPRLLVLCVHFFRFLLLFTHCVALIVLFCCRCFALGTSGVFATYCRLRFVSFCVRALQDHGLALPSFVVWILRFLLLFCPFCNVHMFCYFCYCSFAQVWSGCCGFFLLSFVRSRSRIGRDDRRG